MQIAIDLGQGEILEAELPEILVSFPIAPGGTLYGFLEQFFPENLLKRGELYDAEQCREIRAEHADDWAAWAQRNYTWNMFCREVNHLPQTEAERYAELLLSRDLTAEMRPGGLLGGKSKGTFERATSLEPKTFLVTWTRIANRYAWLGRALEHGLPDPLFDPIPPLRHAGRAVVETIYKRRIQPYLQEVFYARGQTQSLEVFAQAVLYAFGYLPAKPLHVSDEMWERAVTGLFDERHILTQMCAYPGDYFNDIAQEEQSGLAAFFPTPVEVATLMGQVLQTENPPDPASTSAERKALLLQEVSDPAVGTGNLTWPLMNDFVKGQFIDINPTLVLACRALFALYAPWFTQSVYCADALDMQNAETIQAQTRQYAIDAALAYAGYQNYAQRKADALIEKQGLEGLLARSKERENLTGHIRARAQARYLLADTRKLHALWNLGSAVISNTDHPLESPPARRSSSSTTNRPHRLKPGLPGQLSFFD